MSNTPFGWGDRQNAISEKDLQLGAAAANKFSSNKGATMANNAYDAMSTNDGSNQPVTYKTSDEVRAFYLSKIEGEHPPSFVPQSQQQQTSQSTVTTPFGWEERQKARNIEAAQMGVFSSAPRQPATQSLSFPSKIDDTNHASTSAEAALVNVATHALDTMAATLEQHPTILSPHDRAAFAAAMQRAMNALSKCK